MNLKYLSEVIFWKFSVHPILDQKVSFYKNFLPISSRLGLKYVTHLHHGLMQLIEFKNLPNSGVSNNRDRYHFWCDIWPYWSNGSNHGEAPGLRGLCPPDGFGWGWTRKNLYWKQWENHFSPLAKVYLSVSLAWIFSNPPNIYFAN